MHHDPLSDVDRALAREERRHRRCRQLGTDTPACSACGETDPFALTGTAPNLRCYECHARAAGRAPVEHHHVGGRHNDPADVVPVPGNDHRVLSDAQAQWPVDTLRNPDASPLLKAAAAIRGWTDVLRVILERTVAWVPPFLEALDAHLRETLGEAWWRHFGDSP
jgi:hypothetical protein